MIGVNYMSVGYDYPLLAFFWSVFIVFFWIAWIVLVIRIFADIFGNEMSGVAKGLWAIFVLIVPFLGAFVYLIVRGDAMVRHDSHVAKEQDMAFDRYPRETPGPSSSADEIVKLAALREQGLVTDDEFARRKAKLLAE
jgi:hypothetical protein